MDTTSGHKVLIIDDLPENLISLAALLKNKGYNAVTARSGEEGLKKISEDAFELILLDVRISGMDGFEVAGQLKSDPATESIPIIFLTAETDNIENAIEAHRLGALDYISKPINSELLLLKVKNHIETYTSQRELEKRNQTLKNSARNLELSFENLFYSSPDEIYIVNNDGFIVKINRPGKLSHGEYAFKFIGKNIDALPFHYSLNSGNNPQSLFEFLNSNAIKGEVAEITLQTNDGSTIYYEIMCSIFHNEDLERFLQINARDISARKKIKLKLDETESKYQAIVEDQTELICRWNFKDGITFVNKAVCAYLNLSKHELLGRSWEPYVYPDDIELMRNCIGSITVSNSVSTVEHRLILPNGEVRWARFSNHGFFNAQGGLVDFQTVGSDITEKKHHEESLAIYKEAIGSSIGAFAFCDLNGRVTYANKAFLDLCGYSLEEVLAMYTYEFYEDKVSAKKRLSGIIQKNSLEGELVAIKKNGNKITVRSSVNLVKDVKGSPICIMGAFMDITSSKQAQQKLIDSKEKLDEAQRIAKIGSWDLDLLNNVLTWSDEIYRIFEIDPAEFGASYQAFLDAIHPDDRASVDFAYTLSLKTKQLYNITHRIICKSGKIKHVHERCETIYDENGNALFSRGTVQDITETKEAESRRIRSEAALKEAQHMAKIGNWEFNYSTNLITWSEEAYRIFEVEPSNFGHTYAAFLDLIHPEDRPTVAYTNSDPKKINPHSENTYRIICGNGAIKYVHGNRETIYDKNGVPLIMRGTVQDITEAKLAEQKLTESEERFNLAMKGANDGLWDWDLVNDSVYYSPRWKEMIGYDEDEINGDVESWISLLHPDDQDSTFREIGEYIFSNAIEFQVEYKLKHKKGHYVDILSRGRAIRDKDNNAIRMVGTHVDISERNKVLKKLIESETFIKGVLDSLTSHIAVVDKKGTILQTNNAWDEFSILNGALDLKQTSIGANYFEVCKKAYDLGDENAGKVLFGIKDVLKHKAPRFQIEYPCNSPDEERWFLLTVTHFLSDEPKVVVRHVDITSRRKTESKIKLDSEILSSITDAVIYTDLDLNIIEWNRNATEVFGWSREESIGKRYPDLLKFKYLSERGFDQMIIQLIKEGKCRSEVLAETKETKEIYLAENASLLKNHDGVPIGIVLVHKDVTESILQQKELQISELNYKELFEQSPFGVVTLDTQGIIQSINTRITEMTGSPKSQFIGKHFLKSALNAKIIGMSSKDLFNKILESGSTGIEFEALSQISEDKVLNCEISAKYINEIEKIYLIIRDITSKKVMESKLIEKNEELQLFMYRASHDLKGPLSTAKGLIKFALQECKDENVLNYIRLIEKTNNKLDDILSELMEIVLIKEGAVEKSNIDLKALINDVINLNGIVLDNALKIDIQQKVDVKSAVHTDEKLLKIILRNVFNNSVKYSSAKAEKPFVKIEMCEQNNHLNMKITDNGIGVRKEHLSKVFDMFFRATDHSTGSGLGLYITQNAVEKLKGSIDLKSKEGQGTEVTIKIPL